MDSVHFDPDDAGLSNDETAAILRVALETLATWRSQGRGQRYRKSGRRVEYTPRFIKEYQRSCERIRGRFCRSAPWWFTKSGNPQEKPPPPVRRIWGRPSD